jgi:ketosteroid isomerase-like protein
MAEQPTNPSSAQSNDDTTSNAGRSTEAIVRALLDHLNAGDRSGFVGLLAQDAVQVEPAAGVEFRGPSDIAANFWSYRNTFPDLHFAVTNLFACGNRAVAELTVRGTYEPYTYGHGAKTITWYGCAVMEIESDKVARIAVYADRLNMLDQLGALPLAPEATSPNPHGFFYRRLEPIVQGASSSAPHREG